MAIYESTVYETTGAVRAVLTQVFVPDKPAPLTNMGFSFPTVIVVEILNLNILTSTLRAVDHRGVGSVLIFQHSPANSDSVRKTSGSRAIRSSRPSRMTLSQI
jgi:hypothetical protein